MSTRAAIRPARAPATFEIRLGDGQHVAVCACGWLSATCESHRGARRLGIAHELAAPAGHAAPALARLAVGLVSR
jgi:hypothetical protein